MAAVMRFIGVVISIVRELADENAYSRHLRIHCRKHSAEEYRRFQTEHFQAKYKRAKCC